MNVQRSLIQELVLCELEVSYNTAEVTKNICCAKSEGAVDQNTVTSRLKKFCLDC